MCAFAVAVSTGYTNHGPVLGLIRAEFGLDSGAAGGIATAFFLGGAATLLPGGRLADRRDPRAVVSAGFLIAALSTVASGVLSPSFAALLGWRLLGGLGAGLAFAAGASYTRTVFEERGRHLAQGLYGASFLAGSGSTLVFIPLLAGPEGDWRRAYVMCGLGVLAVWLAWWRLAPGGTATSAANGSGYRSVLEARNSWILALVHMCGFGLAMTVGTWVVTYASRDFDLPLATAGVLGSLVLVVGIFARSIGGVILEHGLPPIRVIQLGLALAMGGLAAMAVATSLPVALGGLVATGLGVGLPYAAVFNGAAASVPASPATAQAFVGWGGILTAIVGPPLVGVLLDATGSFAFGFLSLSAFAALVLAASVAARPFSFAPFAPEA